MIHPVFIEAPSPTIVNLKSCPAKFRASVLAGQDYMFTLLGVKSGKFHTSVHHYINLNGSCQKVTLKLMCPLNLNPSPFTETYRVSKYK